MYTYAFCAVCRQCRWDIDINMHYVQSWTNAACALPSLGTRLNKGFTLQISLRTDTHTHTLKTYGMGNNLLHKSAALD